MIIRTYLCQVCREIFEVTCESGNDPDSPCPYCEKVMQWVPTRIAITGNKSKSIDVTQKIMEDDYGLTNFNDNMREGDIAAKIPIRSRDEREAIEKVEHDARKFAENPPQLSSQARQFWGGAGGGAPMNVVSSAMADVRAAKSEHTGMEMLAKAGRKGELPINFKLLTEHGQTIVRKA